MIDRGRLSVFARKVYIDENYAASIPNARVGPYTCLEVKDTGHGIAPEDVDKIFEPFFTTKDVGEGTGLGLSIVFRIIESHHGSIEVISKVDFGTEFIITLPLNTL